MKFIIYSLSCSGSFLPVLWPEWGSFSIFNLCVSTCDLGHLDQATFESKLRGEGIKRKSWKLTSTVILQAFDFSPQFACCFLSFLSPQVVSFCIQFRVLVVIREIGCSGLIPSWLTPEVYISIFKTKTLIKKNFTKVVGNEALYKWFQRALPDSSKLEQSTDKLCFKVFYLSIFFLHKNFTPLLFAVGGKVAFLHSLLPSPYN